MSSKFNLIILFFCGLIIITVSGQECKENQLVGATCTMNLGKNVKGKPNDVKWIHQFLDDKKILSETVAEMKKGKNRNINKGLKLEDNGFLKFENIKLTDSGTYEFSAYDANGTEIAKGNNVIQVYEKVSKPIVNATCQTTVNFTLTCAVKNSKDISIIWLQGDEELAKGISTLVLPIDKLKKTKKFQCLAKNPVHEERSVIEVTCRPLLTLFGFDFWIMVSILAGGGALLLLLIIVLMICACRSCRKAEKQQQDEEELRLSNLQAPPSNGCPRSNKTARGQPAPPIPQYDPVDSDPTPQTPPQAYSRTKAQTRARPPPPPQDDDDDEPPPLPRPRNKQRRTRNQEPYRPME